MAWERTRLACGWWRAYLPGSVCRAQARTRAACAPRACSPTLRIPTSLHRKAPCQNVLHRRHQPICIIFTKWHWRADFDHVVKRPISAKQNAMLTHSIGDKRSFLYRRLKRLTITHQLNAEKQPRAAYIADNRKTFNPGSHRLKHTIADAQGMRLQLLFEHYRQHGNAHRTGDRAAAKRAEKFHPVVERIGDLPRRDDRAQRMAIANGLAQHHNIRHYALLLEAVEVRADTP